MKKILVANRGEIACRIIRAAKALGIQTIAIYSEADTGALHCEMADIAVLVGPAPAAQSYLDANKVLEVGIQHGADGVHPGYGFLSENTEFAREAEAKGIRWIGPSAESIENMRNKNRARPIASACGVPVLPGSSRFSPEDLSRLEAEAEMVGYPLLVKAAGGGGGIGMKRVDGPARLRETVMSTQALAQKAFGDPTIYLERYITRARHIEIQIFGYGDGRAVHLFERECSVQRRFQKIIEESPAPNLPEAVLAQMTDAAVALASRQHYSGAGTVEFIVDADTHEFFFLEMDTRIQVEHGVTEVITGWDLVQAQIKLAAGTLPPVSQTDISRRGAAIECRLYAERPERQFMPSPGLLEKFSLPDSNAAIRIETGVREGDRITPYYDPIIAKVIARGTDRPSAIKEMQAALRSTVIQGVRSNLEFLGRVLSHPTFLEGNVDTGFVEREIKQLIAKESDTAENTRKAFT